MTLFVSRRFLMILHCRTRVEETIAYNIRNRWTETASACGTLRKNCGLEIQVAALIQLGGHEEQRRNVCVCARQQVIMKLLFGANLNTFFKNKLSYNGQLGSKGLVIEVHLEKLNSLFRFSDTIWHRLRNKFKDIDSLATFKVTRYLRITWSLYLDVKIVIRET